MRSHVWRGSQDPTGPEFVTIKRLGEKLAEGCPFCMAKLADLFVDVSAEVQTSTEGVIVQCNNCHGAWIVS